MKINDIRSIFEKGIKFAFFVVPFIPLYVSTALFFPYITGKAFIFRGIVELAFFAWVWLAVFYKEYRPKMSGLMISVGAWLLVVAAATALGANPMRSFWSNFERMEGFVTYLHLWAFFVVISSVFKKKDWALFMNLFLVSGIYENVYVLFQKFGVLASPQGGFRTDGTIGNPAYLAAYFIFIFGMAVILWFNSPRKSASSYFYIVMASWTLASIFFTASRGPVLGLLAGLILGAIAYLMLKKPAKESEKEIFKIIGFGLVSLIVIPVALWLWRDISFIKKSDVLSRLTSLSFSETTITSRFSIWAMSFEGVKEHPILGFGPENYVVVFSKYFKPELWRQEPWFDRSHNIIFDWLITAGFLGLISYLSMFAAAGYMIWKNFRNRFSSLEENIFIFAILFAYFFQNLFVFDNIATYIGFFALLGYIHFVSVNPSAGSGQVLMDRSGKGASVLINNDAVVFGSAGAILVMLGATLYFINLVPLSANLSLLNALKIQNANPAEAFNNFDQALNSGYLGRQETREQLNRFALAVGGANNLSADFKDKVLRRAVEENQIGISENPFDPRPYIIAGGLYNRIGMPDQALKILELALKLSPNKQQIYFEVADTYLQKKDYNNAIAVLEKTFNLDKNYSSARLNLAAAYILGGQQLKADQVLTEGFGTVNVADKILISAYSQAKNYPRLIAVWEAFVKNNPTNLEYWKSLTGAYMLAGDKANAVRVLQEAANAFPEFQSDSAEYIRQIQSGK